MKNLWTPALGGYLFLLVIALGCNQSPNDLLRDNDGNSTGGGGYVTLNSREFLAEISQLTAHSLRGAHENIFVGLPPDWSAERMAKIIEDVRLMPDVSIRRDGDDLMFNYGSDEKGPYIAALKPFFQIYADVPTTFIDWDRFYETEESKTITDLQRQLIHEVAHHLPTIQGDDKKADDFAVAIVESIYGNFSVCTISEDISDWQYAYSGYRRWKSEDLNAFYFDRVYGRYARMRGDKRGIVASDEADLVTFLLDSLKVKVGQEESFLLNVAPDDETKGGLFPINGWRDSYWLMKPAFQVVGNHWVVTSEDTSYPFGLLDLKKADLRIVNSFQFDTSLDYGKASEGSFTYKVVDKEGKLADRETYPQIPADAVLTKSYNIKCAEIAVPYSEHL